MQVRLQRDLEGIRHSNSQQLFGGPTTSKYKCHPLGVLMAKSTLPGGQTTSLPGLGVSDSVTLIKGWDGIQEGELGLVYNKASCLQ